MGRALQRRREHAALVGGRGAAALHPFDDEAVLLEDAAPLPRVGLPELGAALAEGFCGEVVDVHVLECAPGAYWHQRADEAVIGMDAQHRGREQRHVFRRAVPALRQARHERKAVAVLHELRPVGGAALAGVAVLLLRDLVVILEPGTNYSMNITQSGTNFTSTWYILFIIDDNS